MTMNKDELIAMAKSLTQKAGRSGELGKASPALLGALESAASQLKLAAGGQSPLKDLADQVTSLVKQAGAK